jgi:hypothetical protein
LLHFNSVYIQQERRPVCGQREASLELGARRLCLPSRLCLFFSLGSVFSRYVAPKPPAPRHTASVYINQHVCFVGPARRSRCLGVWWPLLCHLPTTPDSEVPRRTWRFGRRPSTRLPRPFPSMQLENVWTIVSCIRFCGSIGSLGIPSACHSGGTDTFQSKDKKQEIRARRNENFGFMLKHAALDQSLYVRSLDLQCYRLL